MKDDWTRRFIRLGRRGGQLIRDEAIALCPREYYGFNRQIQCEQSFIFDILECAGNTVAGEIALRIGDSPEQFYLGHIGYHIDPPYRGHGYAARACRLCAPMLAELGLRTAVITTDPDNLPSVKTCRKLGCELECTVQVPRLMMDRLEISPVKHRFIWTLDASGAETTGTATE